jgi:hypothetical protein
MGCISKVDTFVEVHHLSTGQLGEVSLLQGRTQEKRKE